jgi:NAD(P)-dependent dehydrogenase (short-subunit alcohol dehydrogenase family)
MKVAIVTGGSNGIGKSTALELGKRGIGVILTYHSDKKGAEDVIREIEQNNPVRAVGLKLDLSQKSTFEDFAQLVKKNLEEIWHRKTFDYLVNNGGMGGGMMFTDMTEDYFDKILNTNFKGPFFLTQQLVKLMKTADEL